MAEKRTVITQGEFLVSGDPDLVISTLLGSCVACCLWDPVARLGGVNHMLVAQRTDRQAARNEAGVNAMELLINGLLKRGGARNRLVAKVFGGAQMVRGLSCIGAANAAFTLDFLGQENIPCAAHSVGGRQARHLLFWPASGAVRQKFVPASEALEVATPQRAANHGNGLELF